MANPKIRWNGVVDDSDPAFAGDNNEVPTSVDIIWGGYNPVWYSDCYNGTTFNQSNCASGVMSDTVYFEDYDLNNDGVLDSDDRNLWYLGGVDIDPGLHADRQDISNEIRDIMVGNTTTPDKAPKKTYTWGDVAFVLSIFDGNNFAFPDLGSTISTPPVDPG